MPASILTSSGRSPLPVIVREHPLASLIVVALLVRFALTPLYANLPDGALDEGYWKYWMYHIQDGGVLNIFRTTDTDYVGYHWVLWALAAIYGVIGGPYTDTTPLLHILVKMPSIAFDVVLILAVFHATRMLVQEDESGGHARRQEQGGHVGPPLHETRLPLVAAAIIAFQPAVLYDSAVWAQTDSAITAAMLGAIVLAYAARPAFSGVSYALGLAVKPHPVILGPLLLLALLRSGGVRAAIIAGAAGIVVAAIVLGPWILHGDGGRIIDVYRHLFSKDHNRLSELAWNLWWPFDYAGDPRPGGAVFGAMPLLTYRLIGLALSAAAAALARAYAAARPGLRFALIAAASRRSRSTRCRSPRTSATCTRSSLLPVAMIDRRWFWLYVPVSATFFLNLVVVAPPVRELMDRWVYGEFGVAIAVVNVALFAAFTAVLVAGVFDWLRALAAPASNLQRPASDRGNTQPVNATPAV